VKTLVPMCIKKAIICCCLSIPFFPKLMGQTVNARLLDARTQQGIPYATVQYGPQQGVISNGEGHFSLALEKGSPWPDSIHISSMGYGTKAFALGQLGD